MMIKNGDTGILIEPKNEQSLKEALLSVIDNTEMKAVLGQQGRSFVAKKFEIEKARDRLLEIYEEE